MNKVFLDTSYAVALSARTDENHEPKQFFRRNSDLPEESVDRTWTASVP